MTGMRGVLWTEHSKAVDLHDGNVLVQNFENGGVHVVLDGTIYNAPALRNELKSADILFRNENDAEVVLRLYEKCGPETAQRLNGPFAVAVWDEGPRRLTLFRDRIGKKPLFYRMESSRFLFSSELKSILATPDVPREIDLSALDDYITYQYVPHPKTIFRNINKLPPGHVAVWQNGQLSISRYWNIDWNEEDDRLSADEWSEQLRALLADASRLRMGTDEEVLGAFLSGGVDSSLITGMLKQESTRQIRTFSIGFEQKEYDESGFARQTAKRLGTLHRELLVKPSDLENLLPQLVNHYDEPFADSSAIPTWLLCEMTRQDVNVAFSGDGGDELFAGYDRYRAVRLGQVAEHVPLFLRRLLAGPVRTMIPASTRQRAVLRRLKRFLETLGMESLECYLQWIAIFHRQRRDELYTDYLKQELSHYDSLDFLREAQQFCLNRDRVTQTSLIDIQTYLPCDVMTKVDIAASAHGLQCRAPLLDYRMVEFAARMPISYKMQGRRGKVILRNTFREFLPPDINWRPKRGFGVPLDHWFRGPLKNMVQDILLSEQFTGRGFFQRAAVEKLLDEHFTNRFDHAARIWALLFLEVFLST